MKNKPRESSGGFLSVDRETSIRNIWETIKTMKRPSNVKKDEGNKMNAIEARKILDASKETLRQELQPLLKEVIAEIDDNIRVAAEQGGDSLALPTNHAKAGSFEKNQLLKLMVAQHYAMEGFLFDLSGMFISW